MGRQLLLGAHLSIAGGLCHALRAARRHRFPTLAMFVRNQRQWAAPPLEEAEVREFRELRRSLGISPVVAHGSYLLNLCGEREVRRRSIAALAEDLTRCVRLGIDHLVFHPGSRADSAEGVRLVAAGLDEVLARAPDGQTSVLLETTSGAGRTLGGTFEQLAAVLGLSRRPDRLGVCLDTCHVFAAGWDIRSAGGYEAMMTRLDATVGLSRLKAVHVNDSRGDLGSRRDRHEHIGKGKIGLGGFVHFLCDRRLARVPLILETPKGQDPRGRDWDSVNANVLRRLARRTGGT